MVNYCIITGTSSGIGAATALELIKRHYMLFSIARRDNPVLKEAAHETQGVFHHHPFDLKRVDQIESLMQSIFSSIDPSAVESITLINNAGILDPVGPIDRIEPGAMLDNLMVNLAAPVLLTTCFVRRVSTWTCRKLVLSVTSGAGIHPYAGWAGYCTAKAGLNMFTACAGLEQKDRPSPVTITAVVPGGVDTPMQAGIRAVPDGLFPQKQRFMDLKNRGALADPAAVAKKIVALLQKTSIRPGGIVDIRGTEA